MNKKILMTAGVLLAAAGFVLGLRTLRPDPAAVLKQRQAERSLGSEKAPVWITEYFDYQCPPCAKARGILEEEMAAHPGQIYLQARFFPLPGHRHAMKAALYAECASRQKGKFWKFHEAMLTHQDEWKDDAYASFRFVSYAEEAGLDLKRLDACVQDPKTQEAVAEEKKKAQEIGVQMTPTFYINSNMIIGTEKLHDEIQAAVEKAKNA
jgi:protein-disulfide isomerase